MNWNENEIENYTNLSKLKMLFNWYFISNREYNKIEILVKLTLNSFRYHTCSVLFGFGAGHAPICKQNSSSNVFVAWA